jgi:hypothetical protein
LRAGALRASALAIGLLADFASTLASMAAAQALLGCGAVSPPAASIAAPAPASSVSETQRQVLSELRQLENSRRQASDFAHPAAEDQRFGADPYRVALLRDGRVLGLLRGSAELRLYSPQLELLQRVPAPRRSSALVVLHDGTHDFVFAAGELGGSIQRYALGEGLDPDRLLELPGVPSVRALAAGRARVLYAATETSTRLFVVQDASTASAHAQESVELCRAAQRLERVGSYLVAACLLDHSLVVLELDGAGLPSGRSWRVQHDGPFWGLAAVSRRDGLVIAASGVEDHPLDRRIGSFGYVDSFVYVYEFTPSAGLRRRLALDSSEQGVLTPRALLLESRGAGLALQVQAYGAARSLELELSPELEPEKLAASDSLPGSADLARLPDGSLLSADPLLDAFVLTAPGGAQRVLSVPSEDRRWPLEKLGEVLEYTTLMAPHNSSQGPLSRFTCETCHFEGGLDGRIHHTGRGDILATTKPLRGLFNNKPYFSRALDPDLTQMVHNEFRAAGAGSARDPWFSLQAGEYPWLAELGLPAGELSPGALREALLAHFMLVEHPPNPYAQPARPWAADEARGAQLFRERCEGCHQARLITDRADSRVPFEAWHDLVFSEAGPLVWARDSYEKTGIEPLVHPRGARVPSLRRAYAKVPYFTNGSAQSLGAVLGAARWSPERFYHRAPPASAAAGLQALAPEEQRDLLAFLRLL